MDNMAADILEFDRVQEILKKYTSSTLGETEVENLVIHNDPDKIKPLLQAAEEMSTLIIERGKPPLQDCSDIRPLLKQVQVEGSCLSTEHILSIGKIIWTAQKLKRFMGKASGGYSLLDGEAVKIHPLVDLGDTIQNTVDPRGGIKDTASPELAVIRRKLRRQKEKIKERLEALLSSEKLNTVVQERLITIRNDRYVIPLKPDFSSKIQGIIHDRSSSGATVFVEPSETVEKNNRLTQLVSEEAEEIHRILLEISNQVRLSSDALVQNVEILAYFDLHLTKALYAKDFDAWVPHLLREKKIDFKKARHPLLQNKEPGTQKTNIVPIDLKLGDDYRTLMITGPNTGGKTVALKTLGLLVLMTQAGLPIPVQKESATGIFGQVFADIGDEQSIQEDLSTFSAHLRNTTRILDQADCDSLILLDELGTGTDPREGAALGMAVLEELYSKGSLTAATTHYEEIKHFTYRTDGMMNASVAFDAERMEPAYRLEYGHLGTSHAFEISERLGMPGKVLDRAKEKISDLDKNTAQLIFELEENIRANQEERDALKRQKLEAEKRLKEKEAEKETALQEAHHLTNELKEEWIRTKKRARKLLKVAEKGSRQSLEAEIKTFEQEAVSSSRHPLPEPEPVDLNAIRPGLSVEIKGTGKKGVVQTSPDKRKRVQVLCNGLKLEVPADRLQPTSTEMSEQKTKVTLHTEIRSGEPFSRSINLVGLRAEDAKKKTVKYIDNAHLGNLQQVEIIHGIGSGTLRKVVTEILESHPLVAEFKTGTPQEGGGGVTKVVLIS